ncbi:hypothetical protein AAG663_11675 [Bacillus licheniformis]
MTKKRISSPIYLENHFSGYDLYSLDIYSFKKGGFKKHHILFFAVFHHCVHRLYQVQTVGRLSAFKAGTHVVPDHPFSGIFVFLLTMSALHPLSYFYDLIGIALGLILTVYALKHVSIENRGGVLYFRTHLWVELIVLFLFLYRFLYRIAEIGQLQTAVSDGGSAAYGALFCAEPGDDDRFFCTGRLLCRFLFFCFKKRQNRRKALSLKKANSGN